MHSLGTKRTHCDDDVAYTLHAVLSVHTYSLPETHKHKVTMCKPTRSKDPVKACQETSLSKDDEWIADFDLNAFSTEIRALGKELQAQQGPADMKHLKKMVLWSNLLAWTGLLTMCFHINIVSIACLSTWTCTRWTMIAHHTCHGGYDKVSGNASRWNRFRFAIGSTWRRVADWLDWMMPEAWNVEHNNRHHYNLSEAEDPDLVENNVSTLREAPVPVFLKYAAVGFFMCTWKWFYYSPNTYKELKLAALRKAGKPLPAGVKPEDAITIKEVIMGQNPFYSLFEFFGVVLAPYFIIRFFLLPTVCAYACNAVTGMDINTALFNASVNLALAEMLTNIHAFVIVVTNHAGSDMYRFQEGCRPFSGSFYLRQVLASVNFATGDDVTDFMHGWLNYQIEHHMWPNLSMLSYQKAAPRVKAICKKHNVPYVQESVFVRLHKTVRIMVGTDSMKWFPATYERLYLEQDAAAEAAKSQ